MSGVQRRDIDCAYILYISTGNWMISPLQWVSIANKSGQCYDSVSKHSNKRLGRILRRSMKKRHQQTQKKTRVWRFGNQIMVSDTNTQLNQCKLRIDIEFKNMEIMVMLVRTFQWSGQSPVMVVSGKIREQLETVTKLFSFESFHKKDCKIWGDS